MISQEFEIKIDVKVNFKGQMIFEDEDHPKKRRKLSEQDFASLFRSTVEAEVENWLNDNEILESMESTFNIDLSNIDDHTEWFEVKFDVSIDNPHHIISSE